MKILLIIGLLYTGSAYAENVINAEILDARYSYEADAIVMNVKYTGGCEKRDFLLSRTKPCSRTEPIQCEFDLEGYTFEYEHCNDTVLKTVVLPLVEQKLRYRYYSEAKLSIHGKNSTIEVTLPRIEKNHSPLE